MPPSRVPADPPIPAGPAPRRRPSTLRRPGGDLPTGGPAPDRTPRNRPWQTGWALLHRSFPPLPDAARRGPLAEGAFPSPLHSRYNAAWLGYALGWSFLVCFLTGLISHEVQQPDSWLPWPASPSWLYRATQGTHVATGLACIPLLLAKLWTVYPLFWSWPPVRNVAHAVERASLLLLVGGSIFQLTTGLSNIYQWYWFGFFFTTTHYYTSYVVMGALAVHVGTKIALARDALSHPDRDGGHTGRVDDGGAGTVPEPAAAGSRGHRSTGPAGGAA